MEKFYPQLIPHASTCRSPMGMASVLLKTYYAEKTGRDPRKIFVVSIMPCVAKKFEAQRPEHFTPYGAPLHGRGADHPGGHLDDHLLRDQFADLPNGQFDSPLKIATGAGDIFGTTGGVMEATLRTASELLTGKPAEKLEFTEVRAVEGLRELQVAIGEEGAECRRCQRASQRPRSSWTRS